MAILIFMRLKKYKVVIKQNDKVEFSASVAVFSILCVLLWHGGCIHRTALRLTCSMCVFCYGMEDAYIAPLSD